MLPPLRHLPSLPGNGVPGRVGCARAAVASFLHRFLIAIVPLWTAPGPELTTGLGNILLRGGFATAYGLPGTAVHRSATRNRRRPDTVIALVTAVMCSAPLPS